MASLNLIEAFVRRNEDSSALIVVPTDVLKNQWIEKLDERGLIGNARVEIINSAIKLNWTCDLLVIDEIHLTPSDTFRKIFDCVDYKNILGLAGTFERLDGKELYITKYAPVCDTITIVLSLFLSSFNFSKHLSWKCWSPTASISSINKISASTFIATLNARRIYIPEEYVLTGVSINSWSSENSIFPVLALYL